MYVKLIIFIETDMSIAQRFFLLSIEKSSKGVINGFLIVFRFLIFNNSNRKKGININAVESVGKFDENIL